MKVFLDEQYRCHLAQNAGETYTEVETAIFDGKAPEYIEGFRFIPLGSRWTRKDGRVFEGMMIVPWRSMRELEDAQMRYQMAQAGVRADTSDEALVELGGMVDTALTCIDEQNAALVELAGMIAGGVE